MDNVDIDENIKNLDWNVPQYLQNYAITSDNYLIAEDVDILSMNLLYESKFIDKERVLFIIKNKSDLYKERIIELEKFRLSIKKEHS